MNKIKIITQTISYKINKKPLRGHKLYKNLVYKIIYLGSKYSYVKLNRLVVYFGHFWSSITELSNIYY
jgi:hypothetical protein